MLDLPFMHVLSIEESSLSHQLSHENKTLNTGFRHSKREVLLTFQKMILYDNSLKSAKKSLFIAKSRENAKRLIMRSKSK